TGALPGGVITWAPTTTTLSASAALAVYGQPLTLTTTVTAQPGTTPTGLVTFFDGATTIGSSSITDGVATCSIDPSLAAGGHTITAQYVNSDGFFENSSGTLSGGLLVNPTVTSVLISSSAATAAVGSPVTFTATVSAPSPSSAVPNGSVQFVVDG